MKIGVVWADGDIQHQVKFGKRGLFISIVPVYDNKINTLLNMEKSQPDKVVRVIYVNSLFNDQQDTTYKKIRGSGNGLYFWIVVNRYSTRKKSGRPL